MDWASLTHAYGPAEDVPDLIRALAGGDDDALHDLHGNIWHQGTVYPATAPAVPFLIRILDAPGADPAGVLGLLAVIATGAGYHDVHEHDQAVRAGLAMRERIAAEHGWVAAARTAVAAGLPSYLRLLAAHPEDPVRTAAAGVIGTLGPQVAGGASAALRQAAAGDRSEVVRAAAVLALGDRGETADDRLADPAPLVRVTAALVLAAADPAAALPGPVVQILERDTPDAFSLIEELPAHGSDPLPWVLRRLRPRWELQVRLVAGWLRHPEEAVREDAAFAADEPLLRWRPAAGRLVRPLAEALDDPAEKVRSWAGRRLAVSGSAAAPVTGLLADAMRRHDDRSALVALARLADPRADAYLAGQLTAGRCDGLGPALDLLGPWATATRDVLAGVLPAAPASLRDPLLRAAARTGVPAGDLVPLLRRFAREHPVTVATVLGDLGPAAADALPDLAALGSERARHAVARAFWRIAGDPSAALRLLRATTLDAAARALVADLGPAAAEFAGPLRELFAAPDCATAGEAAVAYWRVTGEAAPVVPVLTAHLRCRRSALQVVACLGEIGPAAAAAVPLLRAEVEPPLPVWTHGADYDRILKDEAWRAACTATLNRISGAP
ncbi:WD-40 repeat-containing protein [Actinoplanes sp. SE50]|nr:WD-40 repeat protein [Actinoplanes sp. SE50/110]ATO85626.1 WD-40 repeat-containing protein [Actinoplanes sp. SE50]SLM03039.1 hypothetical protein ACSP50_6325 [Actinoplanes sp. SE50/110]